MVNALGFYHKQGIHSAGINAEIHFTTYEKIQSKIKGIFDLFEEYLDQLDTDLHQEYFLKIFESNFEQLKVFLASEEASSERIRKNRG